MYTDYIETDCYQKDLDGDVMAEFFGLPVMTEAEKEETIESLALVAVIEGDDTDTGDFTDEGDF